MQSLAENPSHSISLKVFDFIEIQPSTIQNIHVDEQQHRIYISRTHYSEIYQYAYITNQSQEQLIHIESIARLDPSQHLLQINGNLIMFMPFQAKIHRNGRWENHSFTTQLRHIRIQGNSVHTFHQKETIQWIFEEDQLHYKFISQQQAPYHLTKEGKIEGFGKKILPFQDKNHSFTCCEVIEQKYLFIGDDCGGLHVYDWTYLSHLKSFKRHQGSILAIAIHPQQKIIYFSGSDSKVSSIIEVDGEWHLSNQFRGQSHDVLSLNILNGYVISGGITTDLCFYKIKQNGVLQGTFQHKISYSSDKQIQNQGKYILVHKHTYFEIWEISKFKSKIKLIVKYQMPPQTIIKTCKISKSESNNSEHEEHLILISTEDSTICYKFDTENGVTRYMTIKNDYYLLNFLPVKNILIALTRKNHLQKVNLKNGKIEEIISLQNISVASTLQVLENGLVLIASKIDKALQIIDLKHEKVLLEHTFSKSFTYLQELKPNCLLIKYFADTHLYKLTFNDKSCIEEAVLLNLPFNCIRFGGWIRKTLLSGQEKKLKNGSKKYWYGVGEGKLVIVTNLQNEKKKKIRVKQTQRIGEVIEPSSKLYHCSLALVPLNFTKMVDQMEIKPLFTKKII